MLACKIGPPEQLRSDYWQLWQTHKNQYAGFAYMDRFFSQLISGDFLLLKNRFQCQTLALYRGSKPVLMATLFLNKGTWIESSLDSSVGALVAHPSLTESESAFFWQWLRGLYPNEKIITPLNGHHYLGFALSPTHAAGDKIGFQTGMNHPSHKTIFAPLHAKRYRTYHSFETAITPELINTLKEELAGLKTRIRARSFSRLHPKRDFAILNALVNASFKEHFDFAPLTDAENWDLFRWSVPLIQPEHLLFLEDAGKPVAFCLGMLDFNRILKSGSDISNLFRLTFSPKPQRARLIHIGILPEYRGQGLIKLARHRILLNFANQGCTTVENSYMDEANINSLSNVKSTGARPLYDFSLFRI